MKLVIAFAQAKESLRAKVTQELYGRYRLYVTLNQTEAVLE
jgi:hypothetical protein